MVFDRQLLLGVGVGLLLASALSALDGGGEGISEVEVVTRAKALGMTFPGEERLSLGAGSGAETPPETGPSWQPAQASPPPTSAAPAAHGASASPVPPAAPAKTTRTITVVVPPGATSGEVARLLRGKALIADEGEFLRIAAGRQAEKRFLPGTYRFASNITVKGLIDALLTGPEAE